MKPGVRRGAGRGRPTARWIVRVGLWGGAACLLAGAAVHLRAGPDATRADNPGGAGTAALAPAPTQPDEERFGASVEERPPTQEETGSAGTAALRGAAPAASLARQAGTRLLAALRRLAPAGFAVLGTVLVSIGAVFVLLGRLGVLAAAAERPHGKEAPDPRHRFPSPESRSGDSASVRNDAATPERRAGRRGAHGGAHLSAPPGLGTPAPPAPRASGPDDPASPATAPAAGPGSSAADRSHGSQQGEVREFEPPYPEAVGDATPPHAGAQSPKPRAPVGEAAASSLPVDRSPPPEPPQPGDLIDAWNEYRRNGDGHFSPRGLQAVLDQWGFDVRVGHGDRVGAGGAVLLVEAPGTPNFYVLPSFNKSPRAVADWFDDASSGALTSRTQRVARVARGRWLESETGRFDVIERGEVR